MQRQIIILAAVLVAAALLRSEPAAAQNAIYLRFGNLQGECTESHHRGYIDVRTITDGMQSQDGASVSGKGGAQLVERSFVFTKPLDKASPLLKQNHLKGTRYPEVIFEVWRTGANAAEIFRYRLRNTYIKSIRTTFANGEAVEEIALDFDGAEWTYTEHDSSGKVSTPTKTTWDFSKNTP